MVTETDATPPERRPPADDPAPVMPAHLGGAGGGTAGGRAQHRSGRRVGRAHPGFSSAAPPRQLRPCRLPFGGAAVHPLLDEPLRRVSHSPTTPSHGSSPPASSPCSADRMADVPRYRGCGYRSGIPRGEPADETDRRTPPPDRDGLGVPQQRWVTMPSSTSFPSGHSASAAAFAVAVGDLLPALKIPLRGAASVMAFPACTPACTTPATLSSARSWARSLAGRPRRWRAAPLPGAQPRPDRWQQSGRLDGSVARVWSRRALTGPIQEVWRGAS